MVWGSPLCPLYLKLPWIGKHFQVLADNVLACMASGFSTEKLRFIFETRSFLPSFVKDGMSYLPSSSRVYKSKRQCDYAYIGLTNQRLETLIGQTARTTQQCMIQKLVGTFWINLTVHINIQMTDYLTWSSVRSSSEDFRSSLY